MERRSNDGWINDLRQSGSRQRAALEELLGYLQRAVFIYLRDKRSDLNHLSYEDLKALSEDYSQNALLQIRNKLDTFEGKSKFTTWAYRFVINEAAADLRRRHYKVLSLERLQEEGTAVLQRIPYQPGLDPELQSEREDMMAQIINILQLELNERQRLAMVSVYFHGCSIQETAELLNTSPNTLYKMLHDGRKKLKVGLEKRRLTVGDILALFESP